jgi:hypothetical protein
MLGDGQTPYRLWQHNDPLAEVTRSALGVGVNSATVRGVFDFLDHIPCVCGGGGWFQVVHHGLVPIMSELVGRKVLPN